jgi:hypothetical protein
MREVVEVYRGIKIYLSSLPSQSGLPQGFEAVVEDWRIVGTLSGVREEIDKQLDRNGPGSGIFKVDDLER